MRTAFRIATVVLVLSIAAVAHGKPQKFFGTVKELTTTRIVITTTSGEERGFQIDPQTTFLKSGRRAKPTDLSAGERVVVEADVHGNQARAQTVKFGQPPKQRVH